MSNYTAENKCCQWTSYNNACAFQAQSTQVAYAGTDPSSPPSPSSGDPNDIGPPSAQLPKQHRDAEGRVTNVTYNPLGEVRSRVDANGTEHRYEYDTAGRVVSDSVVSCKKDH